MTYKNFTLETDADGITLVTWDMPGRSMNVFTVEVMDELEEIIAAVLFAADPDNGYMTGHTLTVDGGWAIGYARDF